MKSIPTVGFQTNNTGYGGWTKDNPDKGDLVIKSPGHKCTCLEIMRKYLETRILPGPLQLVHWCGTQYPGP